MTPLGLCSHFSWSSSASYCHYTAHCIAPTMRGCTQHSRTVVTRSQVLETVATNCEVWCDEVTTIASPETWRSRYAGWSSWSSSICFYYYHHPSTNILSGCGGLDHHAHAHTLHITPVEVYVLLSVCVALHRSMILLCALLQSHDPGLHP